MLLFKKRVSYRWVGRDLWNEESLLYRVVQSCDYEAKSSHILAQAHGVVLYRDSNHRKISLKVPDKVNGPCLDLKS